jgi:hypothetical protein
VKEYPKAPAAERKRIVEKLAAFRPAPAAPERPRRAVPKAGARSVSAAATPRGGLPNRVVLTVEKITCRQKTTEMFEGADEMRLAVNGFTVDDLIRGTPRSVEFVDLGKFKKGDSRTFDQETASLPLGVAAGGLPAIFTAILVAAEKDRYARDDEELDDVVAIILLAFAAAGEAVMLFGIILGLIVGLALTTLWWIAMAAGILLGLGFTAAMVMRRRLGDDVFEPTRVQVEVASQADTFPSEMATLRNGITDFGQRRGEYVLTYRWNLV